ncbi:MAG TPA: hypothetical protein VK041_09025, partial [Opitutales bacterium]|nr:hypothetical protein [Opitutales bacterium]
SRLGTVPYELPEHLSHPFWLGIAHGNDRYVAVGVNHTTLYSDDLEVWNETKSTGMIFSVPLPTRQPNRITLRSVAFGDGNFVAVGNDGTIRHSSDGVNWSWITLNQVDSLNSVAYGNGRFVIVSMAGLALVSTTAEDWSIHSIDPTRSFYQVRFLDGTFIASSWEGELYSSSDGENWTKEATLQPGRRISGIAAGAGKLVAVGAAGGIYHTPILAIDSQPVYQTVAPNESFSFSVAASGSQDLTYQWYRNGQPIPGATDAIFESANGAKMTDEGLYRVEIDDGNRRVWSLPARLIVEGDYIDWLAETAYTEEELDDPQISDPTSDPGGYNIPNLLRYAFGLDPHNPDPADLPRMEIHPPLYYGAEGDQMVFNIPLFRESKNLQFTIEQSVDLSDWSPPIHFLPFQVLQSGNRNLLIPHEYQLSMSDKLFYRVKVEISEE